MPGHHACLCLCLHVWILPVQLPPDSDSETLCFALFGTSTFLLLCMYCEQLCVVPIWEETETATVLSQRTSKTTTSTKHFCSRAWYGFNGFRAACVLLWRCSTLSAVGSNSSSFHHLLCVERESERAGTFLWMIMLVCGRVRND